MKYRQELQGLTPAYVRPPLLEMSSEGKPRMREDLEKAGLSIAV